MDYGIKRDGALSLLREYVKNKNMIRHSLATEEVMVALAKRLGEDEDEWAIAGILHDLDIELVNSDLSKHAIETGKILNKKGVGIEIIEAIEMHNEVASRKKRSKKFHHALAAGETITGMIVATALVYPDKKLSSVKPKSIKKRMKENNFAAGVDRDIIMECKELGLELNEFCEICLAAMQKIAAKLGL